MQVVVGPGDEPEHLDLRFDGRAVVGQDVHPVVLGEHRRSRARRTREGKAAGLVHLPHLAAERVGGEVLEGAPLRRHLLVVLAEGPGRTERMRRVHGSCRLLGVPPALVPVAREVHRRQPQRPGRELLGHVDHAVSNTELGRRAGDVEHHVLGDGSAHQRAEQHGLHHAGPELEITPGKRRRGLRHRQTRSALERDRVLGHGAEDGHEEAPLEWEQAVVAAHDRGHRIGHRLGLGGVGPLQVHVLRTREGNRHRSRRVSAGTQRPCMPCRSGCSAGAYPLQVDFRRRRDQRRRISPRETWVNERRCPIERGHVGGNQRGIRGPAGAGRGPRAGRRRRGGAGLSGRGPRGTPARDRMGPARRGGDRRHLSRRRHRRRPARRGARARPGRLALRRAPVASGRRAPAPHPPVRQRAAPDAVGPLRAATLEPALARPHRPGGPPAPGLPPRGRGRPPSSPRVRSTSASGPAASTTSSASAGPRVCASAPYAATTGPGSCSAARGRRRPAWPRPSWPRAPSRATSDRSPSTAPTTSTEASIR